MKFIDPDSFVDPDEQEKEAVKYSPSSLDESYQKYLAETKARQSRASIPGAEAYDKSPTMSREQFEADYNKRQRNRLLAIPETAAHVVGSIPLGFTAGLAGITAPINPLAHTRDPQKMFEDVMALQGKIPRISDKTDDYLQTIGNAFQAFPATGSYLPSITPKAKAKIPQKSLLDKLEEKALQKESTKFVDPDQMELPLATSPEAIAEMRGAGSGQPDLFFSEQANIAAGRVNPEKAQEAIMQDRYQRTQEALEARTAAMEEQVKRQTTLDMNAAERARQEQAGTGYEQWKTEQAVRESQDTYNFLSRAKQDEIDATPYGERPAQYGMTDTGGRVDENGIPIRADLSMEAQNLQNPLQRNLWGDELPGRTGDGGLPLTRALDKMPESAQRDQAISELSGNVRSLESHVLDVLNRGMGGKQRGALNVRMFDPAFDEYKKLNDNLVLRIKGGGEPTVYAIDTTDKANPKVVSHARFGRDSYWRPTDETQNLKPSWVHTIPERQQQGLAQEMYRFVAEQGSDIVPDDVQTGYGKKLWNSLIRDGVAKEVDFEPYRAKVYGDARKRQMGALDFEEIAKAFPAFKNSKVKTPLYHGLNTSDGYDGGNLKASTWGDLGKGVYLTDSPQLAEKFALGIRGSFTEPKAGGSTHQMYANIQMPFDNSFLKTNENWRKWIIDTFLVDSWDRPVQAYQKPYIRTLKEKLENNTATIADLFYFDNKSLFPHNTQLSDSLKEAGFDSIITDTGKGGNEILVFNPENVKSALTTPQLSSGIKGSQRGALDFSVFEAKQKAIEDATKIPLHAEMFGAEDIVAKALADGKDGKGSINFAAGATLEAQKRRSPLIQEASRVVQGMLNRSERVIRETVFPAEEALRKLSRKELTEEMEVLKREMFNRQRFSMKDLADAGMTEKQLLAYQRVREMFDSALKAQNDARAKRGLKPITEQEAYISSRWQGDFRMPFHDSKGNLKWYLAADSKRSLEKQASELMAKFPGELTPGDMSIVKSGKGRTDAQSIYTTMLDVLGRDDPAVAKIEEWAKEQLITDTRKTKGQEKHFEPKANVRGFVGDRPWNDPFKEALDMFQQQITYAKNAHKWSALQAAGDTLKDVFNNADLLQQQPNNMAYLKDYYMNQLGGNEAKAIKALEDSLRTGLGISPNSVGDVVGGIKNLWVSQKLALNAGFMLSNVIQAGNIVPHLVYLQRKYGGQPFSSLVLGPAMGFAMASGHIARLGPKFYSMLGMAPGYDKFYARAMKYAEDNSVIARSIYDEAPIEKSFGVVPRVAQFAGKSITLPETFLRSVTFMTYVEQLRSSGKFKNDLDLFRTAEEQTNVSMADYREGERAMAFNKLGNVGNALNVLQTFPINYYNQYSLLAREAKKGSPLPLLAMLGVHGYMAGLMGVPGFAEADKLIEELKDYLAEKSPTTWNKVKNFSLKQLAIEHGGPGTLYGGLSEDSGVALTSRAAAPIPSEMLMSPGAPYVDFAEQAGNVAKAAIDPLDSQKRAQAILSVAPSGLQGVLETGPLRDETSVQRGDERVYGKTKSLEERKGMYARTPEEERLRKLGLRSQKEAVTRDANWRAEKQATTAARITAELPKKIYNELRKNDIEKGKEYIKLYVELSGKEPTTQALENQLIEEMTTPDQRMIMKKSPPLETVLAYKRLKQTLKEMGYAE